MKLALFNSNMNDDNKLYRGLYRMLDVELLKYASNSIISLLEINDKFDTDKDDLSAVINLYVDIKANNDDCDLIGYSRKEENLQGFKFIGFDIVANSEYYSPIGDGFLLEYSECTFFEKLNKKQYDIINNSINEYGLIEDRKIALGFSDYCNKINNKHYGIIETESGWDIMYIYIYAE